MTLAEVAGYVVPLDPLSPVAARYTTPVAANVPSLALSPENSGVPQLIETATTPGVAAAAVTAANRLVLLAEVASNNAIFAAGAMTCAHSMSSDVSTCHPLPAGPTLGGVADPPESISSCPFWLYFRKLGGSGSP